jgi:predicted NAD-dependent protein-ADP-ribosyltransferase YbiA (DUF1768 family)
MIDYNQDGITHINVYSKGKTELGRCLSNFFNSPFEYKGEQFESVEGFWYYTITGKEIFKYLSGWQAKSEGKNCLKINDEPSKDVLKEVYYSKLYSNDKIKNLLLNSILPFEHYYVYGNRVVEASDYLWTAKLWEEIREELKNNEENNTTLKTIKLNNK